MTSGQADQVDPGEGGGLVTEVCAWKAAADLVANYLPPPIQTYGWRGWRGPLLVLTVGSLPFHARSGGWPGVRTPSFIFHIRVHFDLQRPHLR